MLEFSPQQQQFTVRGSQFFLKMCPPILSLLVSVLSAGHAAFLCIYVIFLFLSPRFGAWTAGLRPFPLAKQHFYPFVSHVIPCDLFTFVSQVRCLHCWRLPFSAGQAAFLFICLPRDFLTFVSQVRCLHCWCPPFSAGHAAFLFFCLACDFFTFVSQVRRLRCWCPPSPAMQRFDSFVSHVISLLLSALQYFTRVSQLRVAILYLCLPAIHCFVRPPLACNPCMTFVSKPRAAVSASALQFLFAFVSQL